MNKPNTIFSFFWQITKPYKWWYLLFIPGPIIVSLYGTVQNYALKLFIDLFSTNNIKSYKDLAFPISIYIIFLIIHDVLWKLRDLAYTQTQPFIRGEIVAKCYDRIQHYHYSFFQNTQTGSIVSKIRGIVDGYDHFFEAITDNIAIYSFKCVASIVACYFINKEIFYTLLIWAIIFLITMAKLSIKASEIGERETAAKHKVIGFIADNVTNIFVLFNFASRGREYKKLKNFIDNNSTKEDYNGNVLYLIHQSIGAVLYLIMLCGVLFYLIHLKLHNLITVGEFIFIFISTSYLVDAVWSLQGNVSKFIKNFGRFKESLSILQIPQISLDKKDAKVLVI